MARIKEDVDTISNTNKEDKMLISGMNSKIPRPTGREVHLNKFSSYLKEGVATETFH